MGWMKTVSGVGVLSLVLWVGGCSAYVNIPRQPGDVAGHDPNDSKVAGAVAEGMRALAEDRGLGRPFKVVLFEDTDERTAREVLPQISGHAVWERDSDNPNLAVLQAQQLLIRDTSAKLDVTLPQDVRYPQSGEQLVTVYLKWDIINGWRTREIRTWRIDPKEALKLSYRPVPKREVVERGSGAGGGGGGAAADVGEGVEVEQQEGGGVTAEPVEVAPVVVTPGSSAVRQIEP